MTITKVYYVKSEQEYKKMLLHLCGDDIEKYSYLTDFYGCNYQFINKFNNCVNCKLEECILLNRLQDKDVLAHVELEEAEREYPAIVVIVVDTHCDDEKTTITFVPVKEAKNNSKYGYGEWRTS